MSDEDQPAPQPLLAPRSRSRPGGSARGPTAAAPGSRSSPPVQSSVRSSTSWISPTTAMITNRMTPQQRAVAEVRLAEARSGTRRTRASWCRSPGPPPVITKIRLNSAVNALIIVSTNANRMNRRNCGSVMWIRRCQPLVARRPGPPRQATGRASRSRSGR